MKSLTPEIIRAITPMFMASIGAIISIVVLVSPNITDTEYTAALQLAGTAIAGAAGLAQSSNAGAGLFSQEAGRQLAS
jgi:hypothetical protein